MTISNERPSCWQAASISVHSNPSACGFKQPHSRLPQSTACVTHPCAASALFRLTVYTAKEDLRPLLELWCGKLRRKFRRSAMYFSSFSFGKTLVHSVHAPLNKLTLLTTHSPSPNHSDLGHWIIYSHDARADPQSQTQSAL